MTEPTPAPPHPRLRGAARLVDYWAIGYRRTWKGSAVSSFVSPLLLRRRDGRPARRLRLGRPSQLDGASSYLAFIAPGLLAAQSMQAVFGETTYPVMGMISGRRPASG